MTIAERCVFSAGHFSYLLTIVPFKALGSPGCDNTSPREPCIVVDHLCFLPVRSGRNSTTSKPFRFSRQRCCFRSFATRLSIVVDELADLFMIVRAAYV